MPSATHTSIPIGPSSMEDIQWANLIELDLSNFSDPTGKAHLVTQLATALRTTGCFMIKNFDIDDDTISRQFELGSQFFDLPLEEKVPFYDEAGWAQNDQRGYKPAARGLMLNKGGTAIEIYNIPRRNGLQERPQPKVFVDHVQDIANFQKQANNVARQLLQLVAIVLELPDENQLASMTNFSKKGEDFVRFLKYHAKTGDGEMYATAHADLCTFTLNFRQPVAALQVQDEEGEYKWVKPWENSIMVTIGNTLTALTNGWVKSGMHRIHAPPKEQMHLDRLATPFIARGDCDFIMDSIKNSPVLQKAEKEEVVGGVDQGLTLDEWQKKWFVDMKARLTAKAATSS